MFDPITAAAITVAVAGGYSAYQSNQQAKAAKKQAEDNEAALQKAEDEYNQEEAVNDATATAAVKKKRQSGSTGRSDILTSALGVLDSGTTATKTLLGA